MRKQKVQIDIEDVVTRATALATSLKQIKDVKNLTDLDIKQYLAESKNWETD